jgi:branched-chain amino acid transport system ATP-binding protein
VSEPLITTRNLNKRFGAVVAADDVTIAIAQDETVGIIGANGAGKTTFLNIVTGYLKPDSGAVLFRGLDITQKSPREVTRLGIRRSFQVAQLFPNLTVRDNLLVALAAADSKWPTPTAVLRTPARLARADEILADLQIAHAADRLVPELPQGQRKLLDIALAMVGDLALLLFDEPTSGISAQEKFPLMDRVMGAIAERSATVLFIEHDMEIVERYARRVVAFYDGRIIADGLPAAVLADADVRRYVVGAELHRRMERDGT